MEGCEDEAGFEDADDFVFVEEVVAACAGVESKPPIINDPTVIPAKTLLLM